MQPVASPETMTCVRADPLTPALRASRPVHVSPSSCHSSRGPEFTAEILLWRAHACQGDHKVTTVLGAALRTRWARTFPDRPHCRCPAWRGGSRIAPRHAADVQKGAHDGHRR